MNNRNDIQITIKSKWLFIIACLGIIGVIVFCCFYLISDYNYLAAWYLKMNDCFYRQEHWQHDFFTQNTKNQGNIFCVTGLLVCILLQYHVIKRLKRPAQPLKIGIPKWNIWMVLLSIVIGTGTWVWGNSLVHQGFDEVFSAVNCASLPLFQTLSYYMLPNNHLLFNILNSTLFHFAGDKVFTGKLISLVCFWGIIVIIFSWLSGIISNKFLLIIATVVLAFQFPVWGFGFEARGYALYTFMEWLAFFAFLQYEKSKNTQWLHYYALACIAGYWCIPTFLYFHIAFLLFGLFWMIYTRKLDIKFWKTQLSILLIVYLLYLPVVCFSGVHALAGNQYVSAQIYGLLQFYHKGADAFILYLNFYTSDFTRDHHIIDWVLFLSPLALFCFYRNKMAVLGGLFYLAMWLSCVGLAYVMKVWAIERTMSGHISISLGLTIYVIYLALQKLNEVLRISVFADLVLTIFLLTIGIHFGIGNKANASFGLYNNDINLKYDLLMHEGVDFIPRGSSIAFSDECFYWYYQCKLRGDKVSKCTTGDEQYFVRFGLDPLPEGCLNKYVLVKTVFKHGVIAVGYEIYKRK